jgi:hypothetical protein
VHCVLHLASSPGFEHPIFPFRIKALASVLEFESILITKGQMNVFGVDPDSRINGNTMAYSWMASSRLLVASRISLLSRQDLPCAAFQGAEWFYCEVLMLSLLGLPGWRQRLRKLQSCWSQ